jgi:hypothetical protein
MKVLKLTLGQFPLAVSSLLEGGPPWRMRPPTRLSRVKTKALTSATQKLARVHSEIKVAIEVNPVFLLCVCHCV